MKSVHKFNHQIHRDFGIKKVKSRNRGKKENRKFEFDQKLREEVNKEELDEFDLYYRKYVD